MKYIFYKIVLFNGKNKKVYKKEASSLKLYCKLNGKMIDIKKYKEMCKKAKPQKSKKKIVKKKIKKYRGGDPYIYTIDELKRLTKNDINKIIKDDQRNDSGPDYEYSNVLNLLNQLDNAIALLNRQARGSELGLCKKAIMLNDALINAGYERINFDTGELGRVRFIQAPNSIYRRSISRSRSRSRRSRNETRRSRRSRRSRSRSGRSRSESESRRSRSRSGTRRSRRDRGGSR